MGVVDHARHQVSSLRSNRSNLNNVKERLASYKATLNNGWQAKEIDYVNIAIENINREISRLSMELDSIEDAIMSAAYAIEREEREAREKAEREREEREKALRSRN